MGLKVVTEEEETEYALYNHIRVIVQYHPVSQEEDNEGEGVRGGTESVDEQKGRIVGFRVEPFSIDHKLIQSTNNDKSILTTCNAQIEVNMLLFYF